MACLLSRVPAYLGLLALFGASCLEGTCVAQAGTYVAIQTARASGLPVLMARSHEPSDVLRASLATIFHDKSVCCGKDAALEDDVARADPLSLNDVAAKLQGRHLLSDGRPITVTAEYFEPAKINSDMLINTLHDQNALLIEWNFHLYVCYGVTYRRAYDPFSGAPVNTILKFLLLDTGYSDSRRKVVFNRETDDWSKVQGMLHVRAEPQ